MSIVVTITGMQGIGKTVLMQNLAAVTALNGYTTACLTTDMSYPEIQTKFFGTIIPPEFAIDRQFWTDDPSSSFVAVKQIKGLYITGVPGGVRATAYEPPESELQQRHYFEMLRASDFDVVYVEAGNPLLNSLSFTAVECSDLTILYAEFTNKGETWLESYLYDILTICGPRGAAVWFTETWHHFDKKEAEPIYSITAGMIPFSGLAGVGAENGIPLVCAARAGEVLDKEDKQFIKSVEDVYEYVKNGAWQRPGGQNRNISLSANGAPARVGTGAGRGLRAGRPQKNAIANRR